MNQDTLTRLDKYRHFVKRIFFTIKIANIFFLLGFISIWLKLHRTNIALTNREKQLRLATIENHLALANYYACKGDYETALQSTSNFFTGLRLESDTMEHSALSPLMIEAVYPLFENRDELISMLARQDQDSVERLSELYMTFRQIFT